MAESSRQLLRAVPTQQQLANQEQLIEMRMQELRHARDVREMYQRKLRRTNDLYMELTAVLLQLEQRERLVAEREKQTSGKHSKQRIVNPLRKAHDRLSRRRSTSTQATPVSPVITTSPDEPTSPIRACLYAELDGSNRPRSIVGATAQPPNRQTRAKPGHVSRHSTRRTKPPDYLDTVVTTRLIDCETQTEAMDISDTDATPSPSQDNRSFGDRCDYHNGNIGIHSCPLRCSAHLASPIHHNEQYDSYTSHCASVTLDRVNSNDRTGETISSVHDVQTATHHQPTTCSSDDDHLETLGRKVNELLTEKCLYRGSINNGNNDGADSWSDEAETLKGREFPLRRRSIARRPIGPGVRSRRHKQNSAISHCSPQQHRSLKQSDEDEAENTEFKLSNNSILEGHIKVNEMSREISLSDGESERSCSGSDVPKIIHAN